MYLSFSLAIFRCPPTSTFHVRISISSSVFLYKWPNHFSLIFSLMFATPALVLISSFLIFSILFIPIINLNILIHVLSSKLYSSFLSAQVFLPYIRTRLMTGLYTDAVSIIGKLLSHTIPDISRHRLSVGTLCAEQWRHVTDN